MMAKSGEIHFGPVKMERVAEMHMGPKRYRICHAKMERILKW